MWAKVAAHIDRHEAMRFSCRKERFSFSKVTMRRWNTAKIALWAGFCGAAVAALQEIGHWELTSDAIAGGVSCIS
jgi:hypothetical protein